ncbi:ATP-binding protein [Pseudanabaena sp. ABRG5-3]|uniref:ATP-binding protein n=1 Tax=Pseudanabaena sp. ABRG5-3 TaxID=685565 RepID=UPI000DC6F052|nr:ATP-binding protein [Pseudanabaena sp. ABRG5-3]BBC25933.1 multi-sensor hybrid histidine kinase [Pseudanabaena sp. ABRG5-3]
MKKLMQFPKHKLSNQLLIGFGTSLVVIGVTALSIIYTSLRANLEEQVHQRATAITQGLEFASEGLIEDKEKFLLDRIVQNYATLPTVIEISIVGPDGIVLAHSHVIDSNQASTYADIYPTLVPYFKQASQNGKKVNIRTDLHGKPVIVQFLPFSSTLFQKVENKSSENNQYRGVAIAVMDLQKMEQDLLQNTLSSILVITVSTGLMLAFMGWLIRKLVLLPLQKMQLSVTNSEQQEEFCLPDLPANEIGFLGSTFASVFDQLKDYKQMELAIAESKYAEVAQRYELATQAAKVWVWDWDIQTDTFVIELGIQDWLGYDNPEIPSYCRFKLWLDYIYSSDRDLFQSSLENHLEGKTTEFSCEHRLLDVHGMPHWFLSRGQAVQDDSGNVLRAIGTITDIAERKQAEIIIHQQTEREFILREITQKIRQTLDLPTVFETAVKEIRNFLNADRVGIFQFYPDSQFNDGEFVAESVLPSFTSAIAIKIHDHCFGEKYAEAYHEGRIQAVNDIHSAGLTDCHIQVLSQFQVRANLVVPLLKSDKLWGLLCIHQCANPRVWQEVEINLVKQIANQLAIAVQQASLFELLQQELAERQLTENKLTETNQKLEISNDELLRATRMKDEFLANMSHELRTPLNSILGMNEALQEQIFGTLNERQIKALQTVENSATHLLALINDILDVSKIESGQVTLDLTATSIENLCKSSLAFIKQQALTKRIQVINQIPDYLPELMLDERRIRQVLINLLNNAVKFTPEGGTITLDVSHVETTTETSYLRFAVIDTGIGISAENIQKLFQPFIQIDSALNRQYVGTGLGLALVKRIVELHGGKVGLTSEVGVGSCFSVEIPFNKSEHELGSPKLEPTESIVNSNQSESTVPPVVLLAEDNEANIGTFSSYLEVKGYRIILAKNGKELVDLAKAKKPDVILMDIQMPVLDGLEAAKQIRLDPELIDIPIIALTALVMVGDREKCLDAGANEYLTKPVKLKQLAQTIQKLLNSRIESKN